MARKLHSFLGLPTAYSLLRSMRLKLISHSKICPFPWMSFFPQQMVFLVFLHIKLKILEPSWISHSSSCLALNWFLTFALLSPSSTFILLQRLQPLCSLVLTPSSGLPVSRCSPFQSMSLTVPSMVTHVCRPNRFLPVLVPLERFLLQKKIVPLQKDMLEYAPSEPPHVTLFGDKVFTKAAKLGWGH